MLGVNFDDVKLKEILEKGGLGTDVDVENIKHFLAAGKTQQEIQDHLQSLLKKGVLMSPENLESKLIYPLVEGKILDVLVRDF